MGFALIEKHDILFLHCTDVRRAAMAGTERYVRNSTADFLVFTKDSETDGIEVRVQDHEVWLTQKGIGQLFDVDRSVVAKLVQNLHKLQIMARPITTNSTHCPPLLLLATAPIPPVPRNSVNGQPKYWIHLPGRDMFWIRIGLLMGKSLMKITSTIWFPKYRKSAPASAAFTRKLRIFMLLP